MVNELKIKITKNIARENPICTRCLVFTVFFVSAFFSIPKKSIQNEVVNAVKAESVVAKVAAVNPNKNTTAGTKAK